MRRSAVGENDGFRRCLDKAATIRYFHVNLRHLDFSDSIQLVCHLSVSGIPDIMPIGSNPREYVLPIQSRAALHAVILQESILSPPASNVLILGNYYYCTYYVHTCPHFDSF